MVAVDMICIRCRATLDDSPLTPMTSDMGIGYFLCEDCYDRRHPEAS